jgi:hypothetical protein
MSAQRFSGGPSAARSSRAISPTCGLPGVGRVLEVGCGREPIARVLAAGADVGKLVGIDASPPFIDRGGRETRIHISTIRTHPRLTQPQRAERGCASCSGSVGRTEREYGWSGLTGAASSVGTYLGHAVMRTTGRCVKSSACRSVKYPADGRPRSVQAGPTFRWTCRKSGRRFFAYDTGPEPTPGLEPGTPSLRVKCVGT